MTEVKDKMKSLPTAAHKSETEGSVFIAPYCNQALCEGREKRQASP